MNLNALLEQPTQSQISPTIEKFFYITAAISVVLMFYVIFVVDSNYFDDAFMFVRYADNVLAGFGIAWNQGEEAVYGCTSLVYLAWITLFRALLPIDAMMVIKLSSASIAVLSVVVLARIIEVILKSGDYRFQLAKVFSVLMLTGPLVYHANTGMDTTLSLLSHCLVIAVTFAYCSAPNTKNIILLGLTIFFSFAVRPDNAIAACLFPSFAIFFGLDKKKLKERALLVSILAVVVLLLVAIDSYIKYQIFGDPLPLPFYAKKSGFYEGYMGNWLWNPFAYLGIFIFSAAAFFIQQNAKPDKDYWQLWLIFVAPVVLTVIYFSTVIQIMGHVGRYYYPFLPYLIVLAVVLAKKTQCDGRAVRPVKMAIIVFVLPVFMLAAADKLWVYVMPEAKPYPIQRSMKLDAEVKPLPVNRYMAIQQLAAFSKSLPSGSSFAMSEYGYIGAEAPQVRVVDLLGLHDKTLAHNGFSSDYVLGQRPDFIWLAHSDYSKINSQLIDSHIFIDDYDFYPEAFVYGFAVNKSALQNPEIKKAFEKLWQQAYPGFTENKYKL